MVQDLGMDYAQLGMLIGLYDLPGVFLAFPGGLLGRRFGDKRVVVAGLGLMAVGGLLMGASYSYPQAAAGRVLSGMGAILLNVLLTKMITDWFIGREIVLSLAILVSSFPFGLGLALLTLGPLAAALSWQTVMRLTAALCVAALVLVVAVYRTPPVANSGQPARWAGFRLSWRELGLVALAGAIWALFNTGLVTLPSFGTGFLLSVGYTIAAAGALISVMAWIVIPSVQLGGYLAERFRRPNVIMIACFFGAGLATCLVPYWPYRLALCIALGLLFGPPPGVILSLPAEVLRSENRGPGMGIFYTCSYSGMVVLSALAGLSRDVTQNPAAPLVFGGMLLFLAIFVLGLFRALQSRNVGMSTAQSEGWTGG